MKTRNKIDSSHIWDIRDENLDATSKALLVRLTALLHMQEIRVSNTTLASDLGVSKRTIVEKMKVLVTAGYIIERREIHEPTQTKITVINQEFTIQKILMSVKGQRAASLGKHYGICREKIEKKVPSATFSTVSQNDFDALMDKVENHILS